MRPKRRMTWDCLSQNQEKKRWSSHKVKPNSFQLQKKDQTWNFFRWSEARSSYPRKNRKFQFLNTIYKYINQEAITTQIHHADWKIHKFQFVIIIQIWQPETNDNTYSDHGLLNPQINFNSQTQLKFDTQKTNDNTTNSKTHKIPQNPTKNSKRRRWLIKDARRTFSYERATNIFLRTRNEHFSTSAAQTFFGTQRKLFKECATDFF